jgi:hypothetical protein
MLVVMTALDAQHVLEVARAEDQDPVEALGADGAHQAFGEGVCVRWRLVVVDDPSSRGGCR